MGESLMCPCCEKVGRFIRTCWRGIPMWVRVLLALVALGGALWWFSSCAMQILTFLAVVVALFKNVLYQWFVPARLVITPGPDGSADHVVDAKDCKGNVERQFYFSVVVTNEGPGIARNVELLLNGAESNVVTNFGRYQSLSLHRSYHDEQLRIACVPRGVPFRFDVCFIREPEPNSLRFALAAVPTALRAVECRRGASNESEEPFFEFEIVAVSDNAPVARVRIRLTYDGNFPDGLKAQVVQAGRSKVLHGRVVC